MSVETARRELAELVAVGRVRRTGVGGAGARQYAYLAVDSEDLAEQ